MNKDKKLSLNQKGALLLEALISVVILSVSISLIVQSMTAGLRASIFAQDASIALIKIDNALSQIKSGSTAISEVEINENEKYKITTDEVTVGNLKQFNTKAVWKSGTKNNSIGVSTYVYLSKEK